MSETQFQGYEWELRCQCGGDIASDNGFLERFSDDFKRYECESGPKGPIRDGDEFECPFCGREYKIRIEET